MAMQEPVSEEMSSGATPLMVPPPSTSRLRSEQFPEGDLQVGPEDWDVSDYTRYAYTRSIAQSVLGRPIIVWLPVDSTTWKNVKYRKCDGIANPCSGIVAAKNGAFFEPTFRKRQKFPEMVDEPVRTKVLYAPVKKSDYHILCGRGCASLVVYEEELAPFTLHGQEDIQLSVPVVKEQVTPQRFSQMLWELFPTSWEPLAVVPLTGMMASPSPKPVRPQVPTDIPIQQGGSVEIPQSDDEEEEDIDSFSWESDVWYQEWAPHLNSSKEILQMLIGVGSHSQPQDFLPPEIGTASWDRFDLMARIREPVVECEDLQLGQCAGELQFLDDYPLAECDSQEEDDVVLEIEEGIVQEVTQLMNRRALYRPGDECPFVSSFYNQENTLQLKPIANLCHIRCTLCAEKDGRRVIKKVCRPTVLMEVPEYCFVLGASIEEMQNKGKDSDLVANLQLDLLRKGHSPMPWLPTGKKAAKRLPLFRTREDAEDFLCIAWYFDASLVPAAGPPLPNRFGKACLTVECHASWAEVNSDPPERTWKGVVFGSGVLEWDILIPATTLCLRPGQEMAADLFLLRKLEEITVRSSAKETLQMALEMGFDGVGFPWRSMWKEALGIQSGKARFTQAWAAGSRAQRQARGGGTPAYVFFHKQTRERVEAFLRTCGVGLWELAPAQVQRKEFPHLVLATDLLLTEPTRIAETKLVEKGHPPQFWFSDDQTRLSWESSFAIAGKGIRWLEVLRWLFTHSVSQTVAEEEIPEGIGDALYADHWSSGAVLDAMPKRDTFVVTPLEQPEVSKCPFCDYKTLADNAGNSWSAVLDALGVPSAPEQDGCTRIANHVNWGQMKVCSKEMIMEDGIATLEEIPFRGKLCSARIVHKLPSRQLNNFHLVGFFSVHFRDLRFLQRQDVDALEQLKDAMQAMLRSLGVREEPIVFVHGKISVEHFHLHCMEKSKYRKREGDLEFTELVQLLKEVKPSIAGGLMPYVEWLLERYPEMIDITPKELLVACKLGEHLLDLSFTELVARGGGTRIFHRITNATYLSWCISKGLPYREKPEEAGNVCETAACAAWVAGDFVALLEMVQDCLVIQLTDLEIVKKALDYIPTFSEEKVYALQTGQSGMQAHAITNIFQAFGASASVPTLPPIGRNVVPPSMLPAWVEWVQPKQAFFGAIGNDANDLKRAQEAGFTIINVVKLFKSIDRLPKEEKESAKNYARHSWGGSYNFFNIIMNGSDPLKCSRAGCTGPSASSGSIVSTKDWGCVSPACHDPMCGGVPYLQQNARELSGCYLDHGRDFQYEKDLFESRAWSNFPTWQPPADSLTAGELNLDMECRMMTLRRRLETLVIPHWGKKIAFQCQAGKHRSVVCAMHMTALCTYLPQVICLFSGPKVDGPPLSGPVLISGNPAMQSQWNRYGA